LGVETYGGNPGYQIYEVHYLLFHFYFIFNILIFFGGRDTELKKCANSFKMIVINFLEGAQIRTYIWFALYE
jgi:hypothetical protein